MAEEEVVGVAEALVGEGEGHGGPRGVRVRRHRHRRQRPGRGSVAHSGGGGLWLQRYQMNDPTHLGLDSLSGSEPLRTRQGIPPYAAENCPPEIFDVPLCVGLPPPLLLQPTASLRVRLMRGHSPGCHCQVMRHALGHCRNPYDLAAHISDRRGPIPRTRTPTH